MSHTPQQTRIAVSNHFCQVYEAGMKNMEQAGKPLAPRPLLSLAKRVAKAVNYEYQTQFADDWIPSVRVRTDHMAMFGGGHIALEISFILRRGISCN
jgi:hypothetical protein